MEQERRKKNFTGTVLSSKSEKTIIVGVTWFQPHRLYRKAQRRLTKLVAHDESNQAGEGDVVLVEEARPLSATKRWRLVKIVEKKS